MNDETVNWGDIPNRKRSKRTSAGKADKNLQASSEMLIPLSDPVEAPIPVPPEVVDFERDYGLPTMLGTPKQIAWARSIRFQFLSEVLPSLLDVAAASPDEAAVFGCFHRLRQDQVAKRWIEDVRPHVGRGIGHILSLPAKEAAEKQKRCAALKRQQEETEELTRIMQVRQRRAAEGRRIAKLAEEFADRHDLPKVVGRTRSPFPQRQEGYGRRCRYEILSVLPESELQTVLPLIRGVVDAGVWIGASQHADPIWYIKEQAAKSTAKTI